MLAFGGGTSWGLFNVLIVTEGMEQLTAVLEHDLEMLESRCVYFSTDSLSC
jgi:hypothetical protein